eukprot:jgi/Psemu1/307061/fgenesh1_kg.300_\
MDNHCRSPREFVEVPFPSCDAGVVERPSAVPVRSFRAMSIGDESPFRDASNGVVRIGSFSRLPTSAFSVVPRAIGLRAVHQRADTTTRRISSSSNKGEVLHVSGAGRRPIVEFSFHDSNGQIPDHLLFPIL